ncbi:alanine dehydrogenase [Parabacteroides pacaensis]|uniref:alanine dehydrogenase n=1 Tax=Parabacteroides pacaensis TaxID=2086575 RepID=UPI000D108696|nr:alanine dehydrogenase [Parabacteroides pacaensis]
MDTTGGREKGAYLTQELLKEITKVNNRLLIGIPRERCGEERRLALTPEAVDMLTDCGHRVIVEKDAGLGINYSDSHFSEAGATIVDTAAEVYQADIIFKILPPLPEEVFMMKPRTTVFSMMQLNIFTSDALQLMMAKRITAIAYELLEDGKNGLPILYAISEIEGSAAIMIASELLSNVHGGKGILMGGIPGVPPTEVVIIGAGTAGTVAARTALGLGALVKVFDDDISKLRVLQRNIGSKVFTSNFHPNVLRNSFLSADVVIGAMRYINTRHRYVIAEDLIRTMKRGSLLIDLRVNHGGCFETTCGLKPSEPALFEQYGVLHYCRANVSNNVARTTSMAISNIFIPLILSLGEKGNIQTMIKMDMGFRAGVYMYCGKTVNRYVSEHFNLPSTDISIYLSAF